MRARYLRDGILVALAVALAAAAATGCAGGESAQSSTSGPARQESDAGGLQLRLVTVISGLANPVHLASTPSEPNRRYIVEKAGRIRVLVKGRLQSKPFLDIRGIVGSSGSEQGLLSVAFHPDYARNRLFYVDYTDTNGDTRVVEYRSRTGGPPVRRRELLFVDQPYSNHNGGQLAFGPDGFLYVGMGDGGSAGDPQNRAQDLGDRLGKLLRRDVDDASSGWTIVGYGLRNPWRFSFDRLTGDLYIADVGQNRWEEIDFTPRASPGLENYGWDAFEGTHVFENKQPNSAGTLVQPIAEYSHDDGCSVTGGFVFRGRNIPAATGRYFYGDFCTGTIWSLRVENGHAVDIVRHSIKVDGLSSFGEGTRGELFLVSLNGVVYRLAPG
jgi:glucose/arabinose dehydrogenase